ncbi:phage tail protein I [Tepidanaerobacter syntrophicus]|uniref:Phage tail protein, P2 protein I family n=1 Tax=Tepidanaerobacter syntrophicus TaxID=224999 RepID=A0A0U9HK81_9FIRM|nr:phage tail protein I [Tepidanaerobacter syntrophicus]GAQ24209.1 phage tail protein, P2 protein I family [Tepidanaerobacter syntrophicus]
MIDIYEVKLLDLLPPNLRHDPDIIAASKAVDDEFLLVVNEAKHCIIMPRIDELESDLVDLLAWERHVDFYDTSLPLEIRRTLVKNSIRWHKRKGTPAAVEEIVTEIFGKGQVEEWFEYDGKPYMFKIHTRDLIDSEEKYTKIIDAINTVKNTRSWLEKIVIEHDRVMDFRIGVGSRKLKTMIFNPYKIEDITVSGRIYAGITYRQSKVMTIKPAIINESITVKGNINIAGANKRVSKKTITSEVK